MKKKAKGLIIVLLAGFLFIAVGILFTVGYSDLRSNGVATEGIITAIEGYYDDDGEKNYNVYVTYTVDGKKYTNNINSFSSSWKRGDKIEILYLPENPDRIMSASSDTIALIITYGVGGLMIATVVAYIGIGHCQKSKKKRYIREENEIEASIMQFDVGKIRLFGSNISTIVCMGTDGNIYETKFLCKDAQKYNVGDKITVYLDRQTQKYIIDV